VPQVFGQHVRQYVERRAVCSVAQRRTEADAALADTVGDEALEPVERSPADEQHVAGIDLQELLVRVLAATLRGHRCHGALQDLEQRLLDALARDIPGNRCVLGLACDLVDLVDIDDPGFRALHVEVRCLQQLQQDVLDVFTHVTGLGERRGIGDGERHVEHARQRLRHHRLAAAGGADQQDVRLGDLDVFGGARAGGLKAHALVVVIDSHRENRLGPVLIDDVVVEERENLAGLGHRLEWRLGRRLDLVVDDLVAQVDALVADIDARTRDELAHLLLGLAAERALEQFAALAELRHAAPPSCE